MKRIDITKVAAITGSVAACVQAYLAMDNKKIKQQRDDAIQRGKPRAVVSRRHAADPLDPLHLPNLARNRQ